VLIPGTLPDPHFGVGNGQLPQHCPAVITGMACAHADQAARGRGGSQIVPAGEAAPPGGGSTSGSGSLTPLQDRDVAPDPRSAHEWLAGVGEDAESGAGNVGGPVLICCSRPRSGIVLDM
jgi:hypothetical protein